MPVIDNSPNLEVSTLQLVARGVDPYPVQAGLLQYSTDTDNPFDGLKVSDGSSWSMLPPYSEGTLVPTIGDGTNNFTMAEAACNYTRIGNIVFFDVDLRWSGKGSAVAGSTLLIDLGFSNDTTNGVRNFFPIGYVTNLTTSSEVNLSLRNNGSNGHFHLLRSIENNTGTITVVSSMGTTGELQFSGHFRTTDA